MKRTPGICQLVWLTKNTSYENVGGIFFYEKIQLIRQIAINNLNKFSDVD